MAAAALSTTSRPEGQVERPKVIWAPFPGGQTKFISCPIKEILAEGNRGGGKTELIIFKYLGYVGKGYGAAWQGIIFRREYKHLDDLVKKCKRWIPQIFPGAKFKAAKSDYKWEFPDGESLLLRTMKDPEDYWSFHGHEYPYIAFEELTNWHTDECYEVMKSCNRCSEPGVPRFYVSTTNPWGAGHNWVKERFIDVGPEGTVIADADGNQRVRIHLDLFDNKALVENDPEYIKMLKGIKNPELKKAWLDGDWDVVPGGYLQGIWDPKRHKVKPFEIPLEWPRWRAMDWGFGKPYSIGWYTINPDGVVYRYRELYGWGGKPNVGSRESAGKVAAKVAEIEKPERDKGVIFKRNPADQDIFSPKGNEESIEDIFRKKNVRWIKAVKGQGSRHLGAQIIVEALEANKFRVFNTCKHWLRTVPVLMPDETDWEDVDTDMEDHTWDETRYALRSRHKAMVLEVKADAPAPGTFDHMMQITTPKRRKSVYRL